MLIAGTALAAWSKCDAGITKAEGKKARACTPKRSRPEVRRTVKLQKCPDKFTKACQKAQAKGGCTAQSSSAAGCTAAETEVDNCVASFTHSPSPAFLEWRSHSFARRELRRCASRRERRRA